MFRLLCSLRKPLFKQLESGGGGGGSNQQGKKDKVWMVLNSVISYTRVDISPSLSLSRGSPSRFCVWRVSLSCSK